LSICNHIFPVLFPIEIKETSVRFHVFVFLKEERWFALAKMEVRKVSKESVANVFS
jgi:hypothetical protein